MKVTIQPKVPGLNNVERCVKAAEDGHRVFIWRGVIAMIVSKGPTDLLLIQLGPSCVETRIIGSYGSLFQMFSLFPAAEPFSGTITVEEE